MDQEGIYYSHKKNTIINSKFPSLILRSTSNCVKESINYFLFLFQRRTKRTLTAKVCITNLDSAIITFRNFPVPNSQAKQWTSKDFPIYGNQRCQNYYPHIWWILLRDNWQNDFVDNVLGIMKLRNCVLVVH